ncbi:TLDc domain-containing protein [Entamoeba marina]
MTNLEGVENDVNTVEVEEIKELLKKYDVVLKDDIDEKDIILKYETFYDQLGKFLENKRTEIDDVEEKINIFSGISANKKFSTLLNKKKNNANEIINCVNRIVERIRDAEFSIYSNRMKELDNMKVIRYDDFEMKVITNSMNMLKQWCNKKHYRVLFDSRVDVDNWGNNKFLQKILNKSNLYFISSDDKGNVYGGYVRSTVNKINGYIQDYSSFVFSLTRNYEKRNSKYDIKRCGDEAFGLWSNNQYDILYQFGDDIIVRSNYDNCYCKQCCYDYYGKNVLIGNHPFTFTVQRVIVLEMS